MTHVVSPRAEADLDDIWTFVAKESGSADRADHLIDVITERFYLLSRHPRLGRKRDELRPGLRSLPTGDYVIFYRLTETDEALILHVRHSRRDLTTIGHL